MGRDFGDGIVEGMGWDGVGWLDRSCVPVHG